MVKTAGLYLVPVKGYSKNTHPPSFLERVVVSNDMSLNDRGHKSIILYNINYVFIVILEHHRDVFK
jgi:hypothetical protein